MLVLENNCDELECEIASMNKKKQGRPFVCPDSLVLQLVLIRALIGIGYRQMEGLLAESLDEKFRIAFVQIWRRSSTVDIGYAEHDGVFTFSNSFTGDVEKIGVSFDGSGIKLAKGGDWKRVKWAINSGFIRITLATNTENKKFLALTVTDEHTAEVTQFPKLLRAVINARNEYQQKTRKSGKKPNGSPRTSRKGARKPGHGMVVYGDGIYATRNNMNFCEKMGVTPVFKVPINSIINARGSSMRRDLVTDQLFGGPENIGKFLTRKQKLENRKKWLKENDYYQRESSETGFSTYKRVFGESVTAVDWDKIVREVAIKAYLYNKLIDMGSDGG